MTLQLNWALHHANNGFNVLPLSPTGKIPSLPDWQNLATTDSAIVELLWSGTLKAISRVDKTYEVRQANKLIWSGTHKSHHKKDMTWNISARSNIGICTAGLVVLDFDVKKEGWQETYDELTSVLPRLGDDDALMRVQTWSGGLHIYFKEPPGAEFFNAVGAMPGLDIRARGGQVVAPGSVVNGVQYKEITA